MAEIEAARKNDHPRPIRCVVGPSLGPIRIDAKRDARARAYRRELFSLDREAVPLELVAPFVPTLSPHLQVVLLRDLEQKSRARRIVARADEAHIGMVFRLVRDGPNVAIRRCGKELRRQAKPSPLLIEARHEKRLTELAYFHDVPDVGAIG